MLGAVVAWTLGMVPSTLVHLGAGPDSPSPPERQPMVVLALASSLGTCLGGVLAAPQWMVLRRCVQHAAWWLVPNLFAWACGMPVVFWAAHAMPAGAPLAYKVMAILVTCGVAGGIVGAVQGIVLAFLVHFNEINNACVYAE